MATIDICSKPSLTLVKVRLRHGLQPERSLYGYPDLIDWMRHNVPTMQTGRLKAAQTPAAQLAGLLFRWISGKPFKYMVQIEDLQPMADEVWQLKTPDLRIFGWFYRPRVFVGVFGDYADDYKYPTKKKLYSDAVARVAAARDSIDLDAPKFAGGTYDQLISI